MGDAIQVSDDGLHALAAQCDTAASALTATATASVCGPPGQATAAAVSRGYTQLDVAAATLAQRATAIGTTLRAAAAEYTSTDDGSAGQISALGRSIEV